MGLIVLAAVGVTLIALAVAGWRALRDLAALEDRAGAAAVRALPPPQIYRPELPVVGRPRLRLLDPSPAA